MFSLLEGAQKKFETLLDYVATPENPNEQSSQTSTDNTDTRPTEEVSINTAAIADKLFTYAKTASSAAQEKTTQLKALVAQSPVFNSLTKQQEQFKQSLNAQVDNDVPFPWEGLPNEDAIKQRFLDLSKNPSVFLEDAPIELDAIKTEFGPLAKKLLVEDENLKKYRYELVPKKLSEEKFWHNYLYRVSLLAKLINEEPASAESAKVHDQPEPSSKTSEPKETSIEPSSPAETTIKQQRPEKNSPSEEEEEDWETELLNDDDLIKEAGDKQDSKDNWESEIDELLASCEVEEK